MASCWVVSVYLLVAWTANGDDVRKLLLAKILVGSMVEVEARIPRLPAAKAFLGKIAATISIAG